MPLLAAGLINLALCLVYLFLFTDPLYVINHEATQLAVNLARGFGFVGSGGLNLKIGASAIIQPAYPFILAIFITLCKIPKAFLAIRLFQVAINLCLGLLIYLTAREIFGKRTAAFSVFIFAFYLPFIHFTTIIWDTLLFTLMLSAVVFVSILKNEDSLWRSALIGLLIGLTVMVNAIGLILLPVIAVYRFMRSSGNIKKTLAGILVIWLAAIAVFLPWSLPNSTTYRSFVPVRTGLWGVLYHGNNPDATGTIWLKHNGKAPKSPEEGITLHFRPMVPAIINLNEREQDQYFKYKLFAYVLSDPVQFLKMTFVKAYYFIWFNPFELNSNWWVLEYFLVLLAGICGLYQACRQKKRGGLFILLFIAFTLMYSFLGVFYNWKYRLPIEPFMIILAGYGLNNLFPSRSVAQDL